MIRVRASFGRGDFDRLMMFFKLAPVIGESATLVDVSNSLSEHIQERGRADELLRALEEASESSDVDPINRFWAYDTVTFWKMRDSAVDEAEALVGRLEELHRAVPEPSVVSHQSLLMKQMLLAGRQGDAATVRRRYRDLSRIHRDGPESRRVLRYDYALGLYYCRCLPEARIVTATLADEYCRKFEVTLDDLLGTSVPRLAEMLGDKRSEYDELKRFADTLALEARVLGLLGRLARQERQRAARRRVYRARAVTNSSSIPCLSRDCPLYVFRPNLSIVVTSRRLPARVLLPVGILSRSYRRMLLAGVQDAFQSGNGRSAV